MEAYVYAGKLMRQEILAIDETGGSINVSLAKAALYAN